MTLPSRQTVARHALGYAIGGAAWAMLFILTDWPWISWETFGGICVLILAGLADRCHAAARLGCWPWEIEWRRKTFNFDRFIRSGTRAAKQ